MYADDVNILEVNATMNCSVFRHVGRNSIYWAHLAQNRDQWRAREHGNEPTGSLKYCVPERLVSSQEGLSSMELASE
jgi:hypothetical protein